jgi:hypothetical protein
MTIKSSAFGGVQLTGKDAEKFVECMKSIKSDPKLKAAAERGSVLLTRMKASQKPIK